jgi:hypothetical protein
VGVNVGVGVGEGINSLQKWYCISSQPIESVTTTNSSVVPNNSVGISIVSGAVVTPVAPE